MITGTRNLHSPFALHRRYQSRDTETPQEVKDCFLPSCQHEHKAKARSKSYNLLDNLTRIPTKCYYCNGSGKCQQDYPGPGSGKDWTGAAEYRCGGTGKCQHCGGEGTCSC